RVADYATTHDRAFITRNGRSTFALVYTAPVAGFGGPGDGALIQHALASALPPGWHVGVTGSQLLMNGKPAAASHGTGIMAEAMIGAIGALVILALVFASFLAFLPLLIGGVSVLGTFLLVGGLTEVTGVSQIVEFLIALIGLGVAIDYSLLVVSRWREERAAGRDNVSAVAEAMNHAGRAVVFSGLTVAVGVLTSSAPGRVAGLAARVPGVYTALAPSTPDYRRPGTAIVTVIPAAESSVPAGQTTVTRLESALLASPRVVGVGGDGPSLVDFDHAVYGDFPLMLVIISIATFLLLTRAFRSVVLAAKAVLFNLISLAAAYGVLTWVWQDGHGSSAIWGIPATGAITM